MDCHAGFSQEMWAGISTLISAPFPPLPGKDRLNRSRCVRLIKACLGLNVRSRRGTVLDYKTKNKQKDGKQVTNEISPSDENFMSVRSSNMTTLSYFILVKMLAPPIIGLPLIPSLFFITSLHYDSYRLHSAHLSHKGSKQKFLILSRVLCPCKTLWELSVFHHSTSCHSGVYVFCYQ